MNGTVLQSLNRGLHRAFADDPAVLIIGEDLLDPYGGAFKVSQGLSSAYPERVLTSPISEAGITGVAAGMALRGLKPVVEIMFGDFTTLIADQLINHITKFRYMYNNQVHVPLVVRTPMGGRRGYGATHSQSLEKMVLGVPGLRVLAPCALPVIQAKPGIVDHRDTGSMDDGIAGQLLYDAIIHDPDPVFFVENKLLYNTRIFQPSSEWGLEIIGMDGYAPTYRLTITGAPPPVLSILAYGYMAELARQAVHTLAYEYEVFTELLVPTQIAPFEIGAILPYVEKTRRLLTVEEGTITLGWGAEIIARMSETSKSTIKTRRIAAPDQTIPAAKGLENEMLPGEDDIIRSVLALMAV